MTLVAKEKSYNLDTVIVEAACHSVFDSKHLGSFNSPACGVPLYLNDQLDLQTHMRKTLQHPATEGFLASEGREIYYNRKTNTLIILDPFAPHGGGTTFRPGNGEKTFKRYQELESHALDTRVVVKRGGYNALHPTEEPKQEEKQQFSSSFAKTEVLFREQLVNETASHFVPERLSARNSFSANANKARHIKTTKPSLVN